MMAIMIIIRACNSSIILLALTGTIVAFQQHARHHNRRFLRKLYHKYYDCLQLSSARFLSPLPSSSALSSSSQQQKQQHDTDDDNFSCVFNIPNLNSISNHKLRFRREQAQQLLDETNNNLFPSTTYRDRIGFGRVAVEEDYNNNEKKKKNKNRDGSQSSSTSSSSSPTRSTQILKADDPRLKMTYAEFPLSSYDALLDVALQYLNYSSTTKTNANNNPTKSKTASSSSSLSPNSPVNFVDIGSGLGRIVLYTALTRGGVDDRGKEEDTERNDNGTWNISGIELIPRLHDGAIQIVQTGIDENIFSIGSPKINTVPNNTVNSINTNTNSNTVAFHLGSFIDTNNHIDDVDKINDDDDTKRNSDDKVPSRTTRIQMLLKDADILFMYSTAFSSSHFDPGVGALILDDDEWSKPLSMLCHNGCVAITTDKALNPRYGWILVDRIDDVPNPEVYGTTGYIHVLNK